MKGGKWRWNKVLNAETLTPYVMKMQYPTRRMRDTVYPPCFYFLGAVSRGHPPFQAGKKTKLHSKPAMYTSLMLGFNAAPSTPP